jgi:hypothetical protein
VALPTPCQSCCGGSLRRSDWQGALSLFVVTDEGPLVIDVNPRLVEPMNALLAPPARIRKPRRGAQRRVLAAVAADRAIEELTN